MDALAILIVVCALAAFAIAQGRFVDAALRERGGPSRDELQRLFLEDPIGYMRLVFSGPPFGWRAMFTAAANHETERHRRLTLASLALVIAAVAFLFWTTAAAPQGLPQPVVMFGGVAVAIGWSAVLFRVWNQRGWLRVVAIIGILAGIAVAGIGAAFRP